MPSLIHACAASFMTVVGLATLVRLWLAHRQIAAVGAHRDRVPAAFAASISLADHRKAADYTVATIKFGRAAAVLEALVTLCLSVGGGIGAIDLVWQHSGWPEPWRGAMVVLSVVCLTALIDLPLAIYRTFRIEARFGFNRTTPRLFVADLARNCLLAVVLGGPVVLGALALMDRAGPLWWLWAWAGWLALMLLMSWAWPAFIAPLFNKFSPLSDPQLEARIGSLLQRCGFASKGVFVVDGSRRSAHANAYFTGLGRHKRIVFFDTLLERLTPAEIEAVLAHELGHFKLRHVRQRLLVMVASTFGALALLGWLAAEPAFYAVFGVPAPSSHAALVLFMFVAPAFAFFATPLGSLSSRRHEFQADAFASRHASADDLASALVKLFRDNATTLTPDPLYCAFYYSHPPATERIARLRRNEVEVDGLSDPLDRPVRI